VCGSEANKQRSAALGPEQHQAGRRGIRGSSFCRENAAAAVLRVCAFARTVIRPNALLTELPTLPSIMQL